MRTDKLLSIDRRTFVRNAFKRNNGLRYTATALALLALLLIGIGVFSIFHGLSNGIEAMVVYSPIFFFLAVLLFFWRSSIRHQADSLDYQLMAAFPDWRELITREG